MKPHIAVVTETWPPEINGVALTVHKTVMGMLKKGYKIDLLRPDQGIPFPLTKGLNEHILNSLTLPWYKEIRFGLPAIRTLESLWELDRPDIVQIITEGPLGWTALRVASRLNIPVISEFHTNFHQYSHYYKLGFIYPLAQRYLRWFHNQSDLTLVPTGEILETLQSKGFTDLSVLSRGINTSEFNPAHRSSELRKKWGLSDDSLAVIHVGRLAKEKNLDLAVTTFRAIEKERPDARMIFVGDGPARQALEKENPDFIFCGMQKNREDNYQLSEHYASGDLFLSPSLSETFGNVTLEAMASGLGIVCFDYAAAREHIINNKHGLSVPFGDNELFIQAAVQLAKNNELRKQLAEAGRKVTLKLSWESIIDDFENQLLSLLTEKNRVIEESNNEQYSSSP